MNETITIYEYDKAKNYFTGKTSRGEHVYFDPFVSCAIDLSDDEYLEGKAFDYIGRAYVCFDYSVQVGLFGQSMVIPSESGMVEIKDTI